MKIPKEVVLLLGSVIEAILSNPDPSKAARKAIEAARTGILDEALKKRAPVR